MGVPTNTYQTYTSIGNREDLIDVITNISPVENWFTNQSGSGKCAAVYHEWQTDALAAAADNAVIEGADADAAAITPTARTGNYVQTLRKVFQISDVQQAVVKAGRDSEINYQTQMRMKELSNDIEYALVLSTASASGASGTARRLKGVIGWLVTNTGTASATTVDVTNTLVNDLLQEVWTQGGTPKILACGAYQKRKISDFTTNTRNIEAESKKLVDAVDILITDFGTVQVRLHRLLNLTAHADKIVCFGDWGLWKKCWLSPIKREELARTGSSRKFMIEATLTLESRQEKGHGMYWGFKAA